MSEPSGLIAAATLVGKVGIVLGIPFGVWPTRRRDLRADESAGPLRGAVRRRNAAAPGFQPGAGSGLRRYGWRNFDFHSLFDIGGPWDLSLGQFSPAARQPIQLRSRLADRIFRAKRRQQASSIIVALVLSALLLGTILAPFAFWDASVARRVSVRQSRFCGGHDISDDLCRRSALLAPLSFELLDICLTCRNLPVLSLADVADRRRGEGRLPEERTEGCADDGRGDAT